MVNVQKLKAKMVLAGHTQRTLAEATGMSKNTLNATVNGRRSPNCDEVDTLCAVLNITDPGEKVDIFLS